MVITSCKKKDPVVPPVTPTPHGGDVQTMPYTQSFATDFGTYTTQDVLGDESWVIDYQTAKMTGYVNSENKEDEDWLISSPVKIQGVDHAKIVMEYICRYFANVNQDITLWASEDYTFGNLPGTATWTNISATWTESSNWNDWKTAEISLDDFIGKTISVAVKYVSTTTKAGTIEVKSITIQEGQAGGGPTPGPGTGSGTADDPYDVASGISLQGQSVTAWVSGYIVGAVKEGQEHNTVSSNDDIDWVAPFGRATNVLIANDPTCNDIASCLIVKMPSGSALRSQVNLKDHPENLGKQLKVNGLLKNAFGQAGSDSPGTLDDFVLEGGVTPPPTPPTTVTPPYSETFASGQGAFSIVNVNLTGNLNYVWKHNSTYACMKGSGYYQSAHAAESWLVSPTIDLTSASTAKMSFETACNYETNPQEEMTVWVSTNYNDDVTAADWTQIMLSDYGSGFAFTPTGDIDLSSYVGNNIHVAFKYVSTDENAATWEIKNFLVEE